MVCVRLQSCSVFQFVLLYTIVGFVVFFLVSCETVVTRKSEKQTPATIDPDLTTAADGSAGAAVPACTCSLKLSTRLVGLAL